ncbi:MAG: poly(hydroxyalcanoate) granule associated protein [Xanthomonadales bacterium PRO6]|nr:poly(hydroxyalcanoate) granule associated protein [Xanthomonadales bacterium PRO6]
MHAHNSASDPSGAGRGCTDAEDIMKTSKGSKLKAKIADAGSDNTLKNTAKAIMEQAEQIWLAGLGAFAKAQEQSGKLYETLVKEGSALEKATRKLTGSKVEEVRGMVEKSVSQVKERATDTWDRLEQVFENRVSKALAGLGIPGREELEQLAKRVDELSRAVRALDAGNRAQAKAKKPATKAAPAKAAAASKPVRPTAKRPAAKAEVKPAAKAETKPVAKDEAPARPAAKPRKALAKKSVAPAAEEGKAAE